MPYLQVDLDALDGFADVATATGISVGDIAMGCLRLWKHCWKNKTAYVTGDRLASWFPGDHQKVAVALVACEFLDRPADRPDYHVRGAEKRLGVAKAQSEAGKRHASNLKQFRQPSPGRPGDEPDGEPEVKPEPKPALTSNIQHPASNIEASFAGKPANEASPKKKSKPKTSEPDPLHAIVKTRLVEIFEEGGSKYGFGGRDASAITKILAFTRELPEIERRWRRGLCVTGYQHTASIHDLWAKWNEHAGGTGPPANPRRGRAEPSNFDDVPAGFQQEAL